MAFSLVGTPQTTDSAFSTNRDGVALPAGIAADDVIFAVFVTPNQHTLDATTLSGLTGWAQVGTTQDAGTDSSMSILRRVADGTEGSTVNFGAIFSAAESGGVLTFVYRGVDPTTPVNVVQQTSTLATTSITGPSVTPTDNGRLILQLFGCDAGSVAEAFTADSSPVATKVFDGKLDTGNHGYAGVQSYEQATAAALALDAVSDNSRDFSHFQVALNPAGSGVSITDVDADNAVDQYQLVNINVSGFTETITSVLVGGQSVVSIPDNDPTDDVIQARVPGNLATGSYDVTVSGATETATISGISYTQTHPVNIPAGAVDSNSILADQGLGVGYAGDAYMDNPGAPYEIDGPAGAVVPAGAVMTFKAPYTDWADSPIQNDIMDYLEAPEDFAGWMRADFERLYSDGTTATWSVETLVSPPPQVVSVSKPVDATYGQGQTLQFTVTFDYPAYVTGTPRLALDFEGAVKYATYVSGTDTTALVFEYTVQDGDYAPSGIIISALGLNGGTIANGVGQAADLTLNGVPDTSGVLAGTAPHLVAQIDSQTIGGTTATFNVSYPSTNLTGYEYRLDGGAWVPTSNPIQLSSLTGGTPYAFDVRPVNEFGGGAITSTQFTTGPAVDTTPANFSFTAQTGVALGAVVQSNAITILDVDAGVDVPVSITGGEYQVSTDNGDSWGGWTSAATNVRLNYQIRVRHTAAATFSTATTTTLTAGGLARAFQSTTLADNIAPTITLTGGNINWPQGTAFVEPGYTATDNADGDITADVVVTGTVDENTLGPQVLTYTVQDSAGNETSVTRTVTIVSANSDLTKPVITLNEGNVDWTLGTPWVDPGYTATDNVDGDITDQVTVTGTVNVNQPGPYTLTYSVTDAAGNTGTATRTVTVLAAQDYPYTVSAPASRTIVATREQKVQASEAIYWLHSGEELDYDFDLTNWLADQGDTLTDATFSIAELSDALTVLGVGRVTGLDRVKVWLDAATVTEAESSLVQLTLTTTNFRTAVFSFRVVLINRMQ